MLLISAIADVIAAYECNKFERSYQLFAMISELRKLATCFIIRLKRGTHYALSF